MDANQLFFWLRGFAELNPNVPDAAQWAAIRQELLQAQPVKPEVIQIPMNNPKDGPPGDCNCKH